MFVQKGSDGVPGAAAATSGGNSGSDTLYSTATDTDDIYKVPTSNTPVDPSKLPEGVLFQVNTPLEGVM